VEAFFQVKKSFTAEDLVALDKIIADTIALKNGKADKPLAYPRLDKKQQQQQQQAEEKKVFWEAKPVSFHAPIRSQSC
jgi:hypothetical protein